VLGVLYYSQQSARVNQYLCGAEFDGISSGDSEQSLSSNRFNDVNVYELGVSPWKLVEELQHEIGIVQE